MLKFRHMSSANRSVMQKLVLGLLVLVTALALVACSGSGQPQSGSSGGTEPKTGETSQPKDNFPEKEITFIVPYGAGGGYDVLARAAAPILSANLPNNVPVVIKNVTGGGGLIGITSNYKAEPDGYTMGNMSGGAVVPQLVGKNDYDLRKFSWIGVMSVDKYILAASPKSGIKSLEDLRNKPEVTVGMTGYTTIDGAASIVLGDQLGYKIKPIAHNGSKEAVLAAMRGDVDIVTYPFNVLEDLVKDGQLVPVFVSTAERAKSLPDVPTLAELGYPELGKFLTLPRPVAAPPGVSKERVQVLRKAFEALLEDASYVDLVENKNKGFIDKSNAEEVLQLWEDQFAALEPYKDIIAAEWK